MSDYAHPKTLVTTDWLANHLQDPNLRIIEMDLTSEIYDQGHLPGSIFWDGTTPMKPNFQVNFEPTAIKQLMAKSGINNNTTVVAVHHNFTATSGFIFWLLKVIGHDDVRILDGGRQKWIENGYPLTTETTVIKPTSYQVNSFDDNLHVPLPQVQQSLHDPNTIILDVRTPREYSGEIFMMNPPTAEERGGHIPEAIHLYYELAHNKDGTFKSAEELRQIYSSKGITSDKLIIPYCAVGARSAHTWFILKYLLGYPHVKNYDGSWNEWSRIADLPIEK